MPENTTNRGSFFRRVWRLIAALFEWIWSLLRCCWKFLIPIVDWIWGLLTWSLGCLWWPIQHLSRHVKQRVRRQRISLTIGVLILLFFIVFLLPYVVRRILPGEAGVLYRLFGGGTVVEHVYSEGIHVILPWNRMYIYNVRVQEVDHSVDLLTKNGLRLTFRLSIRYHPEYDMLGVLHKRVGPEYLDTIVIPQVVSVLRVYVGQFTAEEVYTTRRAILERIFSEAIEQVAQNYVKINQVIIRSIVLPDSIQQAIEEKMEQREIAESFEYRLLAAQKEAKRKEIEANGFKIYNETISLSLNDDILKWKGIEATRELAESENAKIIVVGNGDDGLPIILGAGK